MWESVVPHINKAQKNYLCHWCPTVVSGSRRRLLPSRCPGFLLLLFGNSPATRQGDNWCKVCPQYFSFLPEPSSSAQERTNCWVGKQKHHHLVRWISFYVMEIGLDARRFRLKLWGEVVTIRKRRAGWRGGEGAEGGGDRPCWLAEHRKSPKNHSLTLKSTEEWHIGWWLEGRRGRSQLRRATDSRAEEEGAAPAGKEDHPASDTSPASH